MELAGAAYRRGWLFGWLVVWCPGTFAPCALRMISAQGLHSSPRYVEAALVSSTWEGSAHGARGVWIGSHP